MKTIRHLVDNGDGWHLCLYQSFVPGRFDTKRRSVLIVPGYGMNSFIFSYHPRGHSLERHLAEHGFEVWRVDFRAQGGSLSTRGQGRYQIEDLALVDLRVSIDAVLDRTRGISDRVDVVGCSLGGTLMFTHASLVPNHRMGALVSMGSPVRWVDVHPVIRAAFAFPALVGAIPVRGTRKLAELALPSLLERAPWLVSNYIVTKPDTAEATRELTKTVEDPSRHVNRQIATWIRDRDLIVRGQNLSDAIARIDRPYLCVLAKQDGIVPARTASYAFERIGSEDKRLLQVEHASMPLAHADLFIADRAAELVFEPVASWLAERPRLG